MTDTPTDWRGTPIEHGSTVIYGAPVGRSIALVEGTADGLTPSGRVWVRIVRRAYGSYGWSDEKERVHVGADRLTVVTELPASQVPTEQEKRAEEARKQAERDANLATHVGVDVRFDGYRATYVPCEVCGRTYGDALREPCTEVATDAA